MQPLIVRLGDRVWFRGLDCEILAIDHRGYTINDGRRLILRRNQFAIIWRDDISLESIIKGNFNE